MKDIIKGYRDKFPIGKQEYQAYPCYTTEFQRECFEDFLREILSEREEGYRAEMVKKIEGMKKMGIYQGEERHQIRIDGHNEALDQVINIINNK